MRKQAQCARTPLSGPSAGQTSGAPSDSPPANQSGARGSDGNFYENSAEFKDRKTSDGVYEQAEPVKRHVVDKSADNTNVGGENGHRALCSFIRAHPSCVAAAIAVVLSLVAVGLVLVMFIRTESVSCRPGSTDGTNPPILGTTDGTNQPILGSTYGTKPPILGSTKGNNPPTLGSTDGTIVGSINFNLLKPTVAVGPCPSGYKRWRGTCFNLFKTFKSFNGSAEACLAEGGTLAMPRDAETNDCLASLTTSTLPFWIGLHDQRREGSFVWMDGSALGKYNSWGPREPSDHLWGSDCVVYFPKTKQWSVLACGNSKLPIELHFICQVAPVTSGKHPDP